MRQTHLHIQFEVRMKANPFGMLGGGASDESESLPAGEGDYEEMTEDDLNNFARALGGV